MFLKVEKELRSTDKAFEVIMGAINLRKYRNFKGSSISPKFKESIIIICELNYQILKFAGLFYENIQTLIDQFYAYLGDEALFEYRSLNSIQSRPISFESYRSL